MSDDRTPERGENGGDGHSPSPPGRTKNRDRWIGAGLFFLIAAAIGAVGGLLGALNVAAGGIVAPLLAAVAIYWLDRKSRDMLLGCLLAFAVTLVIAGGACVILIVQFSRSY